MRDRDISQTFEWDKKVTNHGGLSSVSYGQTFIAVKWYGPHRDILIIPLEVSVAAIFYSYVIKFNKM